MTIAQKSYRWLIEATLALTLVVVAVGAYVRLSDAGLGCPDWPGCYGELWAPSTSSEVDPALESRRSFDATAALREMQHRYLAAILGLAIMVLSVWTWIVHRPRRRLVLALSTLLVCQVVLGMLTVTWLLKPVIVSAHLLFAFAIASLLWLLHAIDRGEYGGVRGILPISGGADLVYASTPSRLGLWLHLITGALLSGQIFLGVWMSSHYASIACIGFPTCNGQWWPSMDFGRAFVFWREIGINYEFGLLEQEARVAIHWLHRINAGLLAVVAVTASISLWRRGGAPLRPPIGAMMFLLSVQILLGVNNVISGLPRLNAVFHTVVALLLLLVWFEVWFRIGLGRYCRSTTTRNTNFQP